MKILNYQEQVDRISDLLKNSKEIVLATTDGKVVSARTVYYFSHGLHVYFLTSKAYKKYHQIARNNNVALCLENIQIEGMATELGHPGSESNGKIIEFANDNTGIQSFMRYKNTVLYEVNVLRIEMWISGKRMFMDCEKKECYIK